MLGASAVGCGDLLKSENLGAGNGGEVFATPDNLVISGTTLDGEYGPSHLFLRKYARCP